MRALIFFLYLLTSCESSNPKNFVIHAMHGRDATRHLIYRIKAPQEWVCTHPKRDESLTDTTKAVCEFTIDDRIKIVIHNFPSNSLEKRIPPEAQVARWQKQFSYINPSSISILQQAFSGYLGLFFEGTGLFQGTNQTVMGWSLQLAPVHYRTLTHDELPLFEESRSDVTIKAVGPTELMNQYREQIIQFARSFELIETIPSKT